MQSGNLPYEIYTFVTKKYVYIHLYVNIYTFPTFKLCETNNIIYRWTNM